MGWKAVVVLAVVLLSILFWAAWDVGSEAAVRFVEPVTGVFK